MRISVSTVCLPEFSWQRVFSEVAAAGCRHLELLVIDGWKHVRPGEVAAAEILAEAKKHRLNIVCLHAGGLDGASTESVGHSLDYIRRVLGFAGELGVPLVNFNGGFVPAPLKPADRAAVLDRIGLALRELHADLERLGLHATVENHYQYQTETPADYEAIFRHIDASCPRIGITVDTGHFTSVPTDIPAFIRRFAPRIFHTHIKDHIGKQSMPLGQGKTDNLGVLHTLREIGYKGCLSVELEVEDRAAALQAMRDALPYLRSLMASAGIEED